ncbi:halocyanin domain-containing protein [Halorussus lipolyticus]|uniref:halocyanin domain-containing protein n=1 Tax=Halorussus lipolyticus TaxID=3034024 RepID=UPI003B225D3F
MNPDTSDSDSAVGRRTFLKGVGAATLTAVGAGTTPAVAQDAGSSFGGWFDNVSNYDGVVDMTGRSEVEIEVGAKGNQGNFAFGPAAVRVDPGTKVVWKWTGKGGSHNVVSETGAFESEMVGDEGHTFSQTFEESGIHKYVCSPHKAMGMKGAVAVGSNAAPDAESVEPAGGGSGSGDGKLGEYLTLGFGGAVVAGLLGLPLSEMRRRQ